MCVGAPISRRDENLAVLGKETGQAGYPVWVGQEYLLYCFLHDSSKVVFHTLVSDFFETYNIDHK